MRVLQPAEWKKPRGFSHGVVAEGPGRWVVLAGQTGGDEKGDYAPDMAAQVATALKRIIKLLGEAGAGPEHIVRLTWYLTSRSEYRGRGRRHRRGLEGDAGQQFPALDAALYRRPRRRARQGRNRGHGVCAGGVENPMSHGNRSKDYRRFRHRLHDRLAGGSTQHPGVVADHAQRRAGFCVQQGTGAADRADHQGNGDQARQDVDGLKSRPLEVHAARSQNRSGRADLLTQQKAPGSQ